MTSVAHSATGRTWQSARCGIWLFFFLQAAVSRPPHSGNFLPARSPVLPDLRRADMPPSSELRLELLDWHPFLLFCFIDQG